jgi:CheY-like chemotaxis protein
MPKHLLLADDSVTIQKIVAMTLAGEDFEVVAVGDGEAALARARERTPDVVVADLAMPNKNGYDLCAALKADAALRRVPVLLLAPTSEPLDPVKARAAQADGFIVKPFETAAFIAKVKDLAERGAAPFDFAPPVAAAPAPKPATAGATVAATPAAAATPAYRPPSPVPPVPPAPPEPAPPHPAPEGAVVPIAAAPKRAPLDLGFDLPPPPDDAGAEPEVWADVDLEDVVEDVPLDLSPEPYVASDGGEARLREALSHASREVIERVAWEVVPQLAETIIREQLDRLVAAREQNR